MKKRTVEIFAAGCPVCDEGVSRVRSLACPSCEVKVLGLRTDKAAQAKAERYGIKRVPAVVVDGKLADCCQGSIDASALRRLGVGVAA